MRGLRGAGGCQTWWAILQNQRWRRGENLKIDSFVKGREPVTALLGRETMAARWGRSLLNSKTLKAAFSAAGRLRSPRCGLATCSLI